MMSFGIGAGIPLVFIALASGKILDKSAIAKRAGQVKKVLASFILLIGVSMLLGYDKALEAYLLSMTPDWLIELTTSI